MNILGIQNKIDQIDLLFNSSQNNIHIIGLSETKLKSYHMNSIFEIRNYQMFRKDRIISEDRPVFQKIDLEVDLLCMLKMELTVKGDMT